MKAPTPRSAFSVGVGGIVAAGAAVVAQRRLRQARAAKDRILLEAELLAALDEIEAEIARINATLAGA